MIQARALTLRYDELTALDQLYLDVPAGELFGFIGHNGAGKSSTLRILATLQQPTSGAAYIDGHNVRTAGRKVRSLIGYMPDFFGLYDNLGVREYLDFFAEAYEIPGWRRAGILSDVIELTGLGRRQKWKVGALSRGMQQRLGLARVLVHDPKVLLLDEPASGLDPRARLEVSEIYRELQAMGKTLVISSHILSELAAICSSIGILHRGRLVKSGPVQELLAEIGAGTAIRVRVDNEPEKAVSILRDLPWIHTVELSPPSSSRPSEIRIQISDERAGSPEIAELLVGWGFRLSHLESETCDLEKVYLRLTDSDEGF